MESVMCRDGPPLYLYGLLACADSPVRASVLFTVAYFSNYSPMLSESDRSALRLQTHVLFNCSCLGVDGCTQPLACG